MENMDEMGNDMDNMEENSNLLFFHIFHIFSHFTLLFFHIFHISSQFSSVFSKSFHYSTFLSFIFNDLENMEERQVEW
jgi:hypothetical protein